MALEPVTHELHAHELHPLDRRGLRALRRRRDQQYTLVLLGVDGLAAVLSALMIHAAYGRWSVALGLPPAWITAMWVYRAYDRRALGLGTEEFRRVLRGAVALPALTACACWWFSHDHDLLHDMMIAAAPTAVIGLIGRYLLRRRLHRRWAQGHDRRTALLVGPSRTIAELSAALERGGVQELAVLGVCLTDPANASALEGTGTPVNGGLSEVSAAIRSSHCNTVVVLPAPEIDANVLRRLSWIAAAQAVDFLVAPMVADVAASRLAHRPHHGVPMIHISPAVLSRVPRLPKELVDRVLASILLLVLSPVLLAIAVVIRLDSSGPALFRQRRVGKHGEHFTMLKFRTMHQDAEILRAEIEHLNQNSDGMLFKVREDPRITRVGSVLRHYSLDELPQLINVVSGHMSLVGPRPSLPEEVEGYTEEVKRRLLVKPGLTGLWQVSGRSDLPWDEAVRLDLGYVDNWSLGLDLAILLRTAPAVMRGTGAY